MAYQRTRASSGSVPQSLEASLEEENREVLAALGKPGGSSPRTLPRGRTPPPPVRSMLDVDAAAPRHGSIAGIGVGVTSPRDSRKPAKHLDPSDPSTWTAPHTPSSSARQSVESFARSQDSIPKIQIDGGTRSQHSHGPELSSTAASGGSAISGVRDQRRGSLGGEKSSVLASTPKVVNNRRASPGHGQPLSPKVNIPLILTPEKSLVPKASNVDRDTRRMSNDQISDFDDDEANDSSDEESPDTQRGRRRNLSPPPRPSEDSGEETREDEAEEEYDENDKKQPATFAPQSRGVRSLINPNTTTKTTEKGTLANTSSGFGRSGPTAADFEDDDEDAEIEKAKTLGLSISPVDDSIADRHVRMIIRGEWAKLHEDHQESNTTSRLYLACTDLSTEASYSLEWTVGTMLRDGDTLLAIYAIEDETAPKEPEGNREVMAESAKAAHDASETMNTLTRRTTNMEDTPVQHWTPKAAPPFTKFIPVTEAPTSTGSVDARKTSKKDMERLRAMDTITQNFLKLVRKTPLQVRCMIEVIHCKSPKHLILNAIDELGPTLCVVGTRGRSSLKGVLLGSFSNYLVTKSSVPVMVARRRKKKPRHAKVNSSSIRLSNNLTNSAISRPKRSLQNARID